jgi:hypothetical protein
MSGPYAEGAWAILRAGYSAISPASPTGDAVIASGVTGYEGRMAFDVNIRTWVQTGREHIAAARMPQRADGLDAATPRLLEGFGCRAESCTHPPNPMPEFVSVMTRALGATAFDYADRSPRERRALERARRENPGRAIELRRMDQRIRLHRRLQRGRP